MWKLLGQSWRSILSVIIAYILTIVMFLYEGDLLNTFVTWSSGMRLWMKDLVGGFSERGETLFAFTINDFTTFMTLMIVFVRVVVVTAAVGIGNLVVKVFFSRR